MAISDLPNLKGGSVIELLREILDKLDMVELTIRLGSKIRFSSNLNSSAVIEN